MKNHLICSNVGLTLEEKNILHGLDLQITEGNIHSIVGTTGSGKSLILKLLAGMVAPSSGSIERMPNGKLAFVFQDNPFLGWLSIEKNIELSTGIGRNDLRQWFERFNLAEYAQLYPKQLSGGTRQKFNLIRAFINRAELILLDEPFAHLDQIQREDLYNFTIKLWREYRPTIVLVTHDIDEAIYLSHRLYFLSKKEKRIMSQIEIKSPSEDHVQDLLHEKSGASYLGLFNQVYSLYKKDGQE